MSEESHVNSKTKVGIKNTPILADGGRPSSWPGQARAWWSTGVHGSWKSCVKICEKTIGHTQTLHDLQY